LSRVAYVNGRYGPKSEATVHIEDRGYQFADAVYEVWGVTGGRLMDYDGHMTRLERSLDELKIRRPMSRAALTQVLRETVRRNRVRNGLVYLQISRGTAPRDHAFPAVDTPPSVVVTAKSLDRAKAEAVAARGVGVITRPDTRWGRCDIKTVGLLPNILAKQEALDASAGDAWLVDDMGVITEGTASNAWIVDAEGVLRTRDTQANILRGITRAAIVRIAAEQGLKLEERGFTPDDVKSAREAFFTNASGFATPVVAIDGAPIGSGKPGPLALRLREIYLERAEAESI
jgi:D-alanine transaminase